MLRRVGNERPPPDWEDPRRVLARHGLAPKRGFSQNFLVSRSAVEKIALAVAPAPGELVVELGAGLGTLTGALLRAGAHVIAIERDRDMAGVLRAELDGVERFELIEADAAALDLASLAARAGGRVAIAGNLPYAITGQILRALVDGVAHVSRAVVMIQREVRDRLLAPPGTKTYGALTVHTTSVFRVEPIVRVSAGSFHPPPKVESAVVRLVPLDRPRAEPTAAFREVVRASFEARRKTLRNALVQLAGGDGARVDRALVAAAIDGTRRGETLSVEELDAVAKAWASG